MLVNALQHIPIYLQPFTNYSEVLVGNCNFFLPPCIYRPRWGCSHWNSGKKVWSSENQNHGVTRQWRQFDDGLSRFDTIPACDWRTDRRTWDVNWTNRRTDVQPMPYSNNVRSNTDAHLKITITRSSFLISKMQPKQCRLVLCSMVSLQCVTVFPDPLADADVWGRGWWGNERTCADLTRNTNDITDDVVKDSTDNQCVI